MIVKRNFAEQTFYSFVYDVLLYHIFMYALPLVILGLLSYRLRVVVVEARRRRQLITSTQAHRQDLTASLLAVVIVFMLCQITAPLRRLLIEILPDSEQQCPNFLYFIGDVNSLLITLNSACNFVIYCIFGARFRRRVSALVKIQSRKVAPIEQHAPRFVGPSASVMLNLQVAPFNNPRFSVALEPRREA